VAAKFGEWAYGQYGVTHIVCVDEAEGGSVEVIPLGVEAVDSTLRSEYDSLDKLPQWVQRKIAVLMAANLGDTIEHVGRRVDVDTFFIVEERNND
jgi:hypothetical protein